ncbi:MAG: ribonuclease R [Balneolaceae bacterium]
MAKKQRLTSLEEEIIKILKSYPDASIPAPVLREALGIKGKNADKKLKRTLHSLRNKDQIRMTKGNLVSINEVYAEDENLYEGVLDVNKYGDGYVVTEGRDQDIKIPSRYLGTALDGDTVKAKVTHYHKKSNKPVGRVEEVVKRGKMLFVGTLDSPADDTWLIRADEQSSRTDFFVERSDIKDAEPGDKVTFRLIQWEDVRGLPRAQIVEVLGEPGSNEANILSILAEHQFDLKFPEEVEHFAASIDDRIPEEEITRRKDMREEIIFTIDPADAKDFDDALSIKILDNGNYYLGVHIADVTHYMPRGSALDEEALARGTSVYLVDRVIPMLPEKLSNHVCSLRPDEDKLTYSCFMEITPAGKLVDYSIEEVVIHSRQRFVYDEVQEILDGKNHPLKRLLKSAEKLAKTLMDNRFNAGSINFETPEPKFVLDQDGKPVDVIIKKRLFAHRLIEECMLMANKTVAYHIDNLRSHSDKGKNSNNHPFLYRIHDQPDLEKLFNIRENVKPLGIEFDVKKQIRPKDINALLKKVEGTNMESIINDLTLRAMSKAVYSPENVGHFGLGFSHYSHFTSPIRRYPDVIIHRLLKRYGSGGQEYTFTELEEIGEQCSEKERYAVAAERDSVKLKQVEFLSGRLGEVFKGVISGVTENGLYVSLKEVYCEGMIHVSDLKDDYYIYNSQRHCLLGRSKGKQYRLGDEIDVKVVKTDMERRHIDLLISKD